MPHRPSDLAAASLRLHRAIRHRMQESRPRNEQTTMFHTHVLGIVADHGQITMKHLAETLRITAPSATSIVNRLEAYKLVARRQGKDNRKTVRVHLTAKGKKLLQEKMQMSQAALSEIFGVLPQKDQKELQRILETLLERIGMRDDEEKEDGCCC